MDEYGIYAQILYPNVGGFGSGNFLELEERPLMLDCIRAYNDFLSEWSSADPQRLIPIMTMPFWDVDACVAEMQRSAKLGHKGVLMTNQPHVFGFPAITDPHWNPLWESAQELDLPINFHIGSGDLLTTIEEATVHNGKQAAGSKNAVLFFLDNSVAVLDVILSGICHRYPKLKFVSVESGIGWVPFVLEAADWQWNNSGAIYEHPEMDLLPSEYFKRQVYACFWFEEASAVKAIEQIGSENVLYETDYPHPTSMSPGGGSIARVPQGPDRACAQRPAGAGPAQHPPRQRRSAVPLERLGIVPLSRTSRGANTLAPPAVGAPGMVARPAKAGAGRSPCRPAKDLQAILVADGLEVFVERAHRAEPVWHRERHDANRERLNPLHGLGGRNRHGDYHRGGARALERPHPRGHCCPRR